MNSGTTIFTLASVLNMTGGLLSNFLSCGFPGASIRTFKLIPTPAPSATGLPDAGNSPAADCGVLERPCAAASIELNPSAVRWPEAVCPTDIAAGSTETLFEMASRIGITAIASDNYREARLILMHAGGQQQDAPFRA